MKKMGKKEQEALAGLSKSAAKLYARVREGHFYRPYDERCPKAMKELEMAGLVTATGRITQIELCFVPVHGYKPFEMEKFEAVEK